MNLNLFLFFFGFAACIVILVMGFVLFSLKEQLAQKDTSLIEQDKNLEKIEYILYKQLKAKFESKEYVLSQKKKRQ